MAVWSVDVKITATAYIRAETQEEALKLAKELEGDGLELFEQDGDLPISGKQYDDPDLPDVSLSPAMTVHGPEEGNVPERADD